MAVGLAKLLGGKALRPVGRMAQRGRASAKFGFMNTSQARKELLEMKQLREKRELWDLTKKNGKYMPPKFDDNGNIMRKADGTILLSRTTKKVGNYQKGMDANPHLKDPKFDKADFKKLEELEKSLPQNKEKLLKESKFTASSKNQDSYVDPEDPNNMIPFDEDELKAVNREQLHYGIGGVDAALFGGPLALGAVGGMAKGAHEWITDSEFNDTLQMQSMAQQAQISGMANTQRRDKAMQESLRRLASANPEIANALMAGRELPMGASVFGGKPNTELLRSIGGMMADQQFQTPTDPLMGLM